MHPTTEPRKTSPRHQTVYGILGSFTPPDWAATGTPNCHGVDPELFFPPRGRVDPDDRREAMATCRHCELLDQCREWAIEQGPTLFGIWGGTTQEQRFAIRRRFNIQRRLNTD